MRQLRKFLRKSTAWFGRAKGIWLVTAVCLSSLGIVAGSNLAHASTTPTSSTARFAAAATPFQNKVINDALQRSPGGVRVSAGQVEWGGDAQLSVATAPNGNVTPAVKSACPSGNFCGWSGANFSGACLMEVPANQGWWGDWAAYSGTYCGSAGTWSWYNNSDYRAWKEQGHSGGKVDAKNPYYYTGGSPSGTSWCISPHVSNKDVTDRITRTLGWMYASGTAAACP